MTLQEFVNKYNGVHIDEDGYYGAQCWDLSARYAREVAGCPSFPTVTGGAAGLFTNTAAVILQYFDRVANNPNDANQIPPDGAVIVWGTAWSPPYGHTAVKISGGVGQNMTVIEQNGNNPGGAAYIKTRNYSGVSGWLVPKNKGVNTMIIQNSDDWYARLDKLHLQVLGRRWNNRPDLQWWAGKDLLTFVEQISDSKEAETALNWQTVGEVAVRDKWDQQIYGLQDQVKALTAQLATNNSDTLTLQQQFKDLSTKFDELVKVSQIKDQQIKDLTAKLATQSNDSQLLNGFGEWLQKLIARLGVKKG